MDSIKKCFIFLIILALPPFAYAFESNNPNIMPQSVKAHSGNIANISGYENLASGCQQVRVEFTWTAAGSTDDGGGFDEIHVELWDDGTRKDHEIHQIPVGSTITKTTILEYSGAVGFGAAGVGLFLNDMPIDQTIFGIDPYFPTSTTASCKRYGFVDLDLTGGAVPDDIHCFAEKDYGRMVVDEQSGTLYVCAASGWSAK
jgi:hypothetical protein